MEDELKGSDQCEHGISLVGGLGESRDRSAYGTRTLTHTDWHDQSAPNHANANPSVSMENFEPESAASGCENGGDFIASFRLSILGEPKLNTALNTENQQGNGQSNGGFSTDL